MHSESPFRRARQDDASASKTPDRPGRTEGLDDRASSERALDERPIDEGDGMALLDGSPDFEILVARDPLAAEPLSAEEVKAIEARGARGDEEQQLGLQELARMTEVDLPFDPESDTLADDANDERLDVRMRPRAKR